MCVCMKTGLFENVAHRRRRRRGAWADGRRVYVPSSSKNRSARVQICIIPEKEECGAVAGEYKTNPVRRERERKETQRWRIQDADMLPLMLASADAFRDSYRCLRFLSFPSPYIQCRSSLCCGVFCAFLLPFSTTTNKHNPLWGTKHGSGGDFDLLF